MSMHVDPFAETIPGAARDSIDQTVERDVVSVSAQARRRGR